MIYQHYGIEKSVEQILHEFDLPKKELDHRLATHGFSIFSLGRSLLKNSFAVTARVNDVRTFPPELKGCSSQKIIAYLENTLKTTSGRIKNYFANVLAFVRAGGRLSINLVTAKDIADSLRKKHPPIICIERKCLYGKGVGMKGHVVIPVNVTLSTITLNDSHPVYGGIKKYSLEQFLFAMYSRHLYTLFIEPRSRKN